nr:MAG TPA: hypothetical protein [Caudoviricetes sp.]
MRTDACFFVLSLPFRTKWYQPTSCWRSRDCLS